MTTLGFSTYLDHLRRESHRFREVLGACDPAARVPGCPDWDAADLLWHLAEVQWFWATIIRTRPAGPDELAHPERPATYDGLLAAFDEHSSALVSALAAADPSEPAWTWSSEQSVGFTYRRQAHEALIHRLDAEQTAGQVTTLDPALAADGVLELLDVMYGGKPPWGTFTPLPQHLRIECSDTSGSLWVQLGRFTGTNPRDGAELDETDLLVVPDPGTPADAVISGPAAALDTWLWRRCDDAEVTVQGDREIYDRFREVVDQPLD